MIAKILTICMTFAYSSYCLADVIGWQKTEYAAISHSSQEHNTGKVENKVIGASCAHDDKKCAASAMTNHVVRKAEFWAKWTELHLNDRIAPANRQLIQYLNLDNIRNSIEFTVKTARTDPALLRDIQAAISEMPNCVRKMIDKKLVGIFLVENLGGSGYSDYVFDLNGVSKKGFIILDTSVLSNKTANQWATWKENTAFIKDSKYKVNVAIENTANDNRKNAIQYILLHEFGHIVSINQNAHPSWDRPDDAIGPSGSYPFFEGSWKFEPQSGRFTSNFDRTFVFRPLVKFYFHPELRASVAQNVYSGLALTNFPTLYASTNPYDDFAESFANFVHVVLLKKPWQTTVTQEGKPLYSLKSCWNEIRCGGKKAFLEDLFK